MNEPKKSPDRRPGFRLSGAARLLLTIALVAFLAVLVPSIFTSREPDSPVARCMDAIRLAPASLQVIRNPGDPSPPVGLIFLSAAFWTIFLSSLHLFLLIRIRRLTTRSARWVGPLMTPFYAMLFAALYDPEAGGWMAGPFGPNSYALPAFLIALYVWSVPATRAGLIPLATVYFLSCLHIAASGWGIVIPYVPSGLLLIASLNLPRHRRLRELLRPAPLPRLRRVTNGGAA